MWAQIETDPAQYKDRRRITRPLTDSIASTAAHARATSVIIILHHVFTALLLMLFTVALFHALALALALAIARLHSIILHHSSIPLGVTLWPHACTGTVGGQGHALIAGTFLHALDVLGSQLLSLLDGLCFAHLLPVLETFLFGH